MFAKLHKKPPENPLLKSWAARLDAIRLAKTQEQVRLAASIADGFVIAASFALSDKEIAFMRAEQAHVMRAVQESVVDEEAVAREKERRATLLANEAVKIEREFWVEQCRQMQNQVQTHQAMTRNVLEHVARNAPIGEGALRGILDDTLSALAKPLTQVEAVRAFVAHNDPKTQGAYKAKGGHPLVEMRP